MLSATLSSSVSVPSDAKLLPDDSTADTMLT